ncbi:hypothetical protein GCM10022223_26440 [Kineosporia mesophila]|uniref:Uncharacterized protein n=1 Tax=Kineosporia mesophila TaxID=566012 RepID=A0ABP6ZII6_9ACTN
MSARGRVLLTLRSNVLTYLVGGPVIAAFALGWLRLPLTEPGERMPAVAR